MARRITLPENHVAVILSNELADDLMSLLKIVRRDRARLTHDIGERGSIHSVAGDAMLAILEAREA